MVVWHATPKLEAMIRTPSTVRTTADSYQIHYVLNQLWFFVGTVVKKKI